MHGWRSGDNPARWKGMLDKVLPKPERLKKREHFAAAGYEELPGIMDALRQHKGIAHPDRLPIRRGSRCPVERD